MRFLLCMSGPHGPGSRATRAILGATLLGTSDPGTAARGNTLPCPKRSRPFLRRAEVFTEDRGCLRAAVLSFFYTATVLDLI